MDIVEDIGSLPTDRQDAPQREAVIERVAVHD